MTITIESNIWCDLASQWVARNGVEGLDGLQRARLVDHASRCQRCADLQPLAAEEASSDMGSVAEWPHAADETLRLIVTGDLSQKEQRIIEISVEPHIQMCDYCADRLAAVEEWPEVSEPCEAVVGRAATLPVRWTENHAEFGWIMDQPASGLSMWRVSFELTAGILEARLSVEGDGVPEAWRFSLPLATDEELLPTIGFTPDSLVAQCACAAGTRAKWETAPILTMPLAPWTRLVSVGEDPATMVSMDDTNRLEITLRVPYEGLHEYKAVARWLNTLLVDLRGERLECACDRAGDLAGSVVDRRGRQVGSWAVGFMQERMINLVVSPARGEILRLATTVLDGEVPHNPLVIRREPRQDNVATVPRLVRRRPAPISLPLAAGNHKSDQGDTLVAFGQFGGFRIFEDQRDGRVFLTGPVPERARFVLFGDERYEIQYSAEVDMFEVVGLGSGDMAQFLDQQNLVQASNPGEAVSLVQFE